MISVTARVSMAETITGRMAHLGLISYKDFDASRTAEGRRPMVCEYESLDRLVKEPVVDILIINEARAVVKAVTIYETNRDQRIQLRDATTAGEEVREADGDVRRSQPGSCRRDILQFDVLQVGGKQLLPPPTGFRRRGPDGLMGPLIIYPPPPPKATVRRINVPKPILQRAFIQAPLTTAVTMMVEDIRHERKVVGCFGSTGYMDATEANLKVKFPDIRTRSYGADSPHKAELVDIETHWAELDVIFCTSTITCALDFNQQVHNVYLFPDIFTVTPRDVLQMAGRATWVITFLIVLALPKRHKKTRGNQRAPPRRTYFFPRSHDMTAATEAEVAKIMASRDVNTNMMVQVRNRFLEECRSDTIKYLPDNM